MNFAFQHRKIKGKYKLSCRCQKEQLQDQLEDLLMMKETFETYEHYFSIKDQVNGNQKFADQFM